MFCNKCGAVVDAGSNSCARCGTAVVGGSQTPAYSSPAIGYVGSKLERRLAVLVVLWIIYGVLEAARAAAFQFAAHLSRFWVTGPDWSRWGAPGILHWVVMWSACGALLAFFAAWGLHERRSWARVVAIVSAVFALTHPPFGTILGVYTLVVLLSADAATNYERMVRL